jgi:hypothetical protein
MQQEAKVIPIQIRHLVISDTILNYVCVRKCEEMIGHCCRREAKLKFKMVF